MKKSKLSLPCTYHIPGRPHPGYSLLGRRLARCAETRWHADARLIVFFGVGATVLVLLTIATWTLAHGILPWMVLVWMAFLSATLVGFEPVIFVEIKNQKLLLSQGARTCTVPLESITSAEVIDALTWHRGYRRDSSAQNWVNRPMGDVLLLKSEEGALILGLPPEEHRLLLEMLSRRTEEWKDERVEGELSP